MDGYFPSELQMHYPDGIPLQVKQRKACSGFFQQSARCSPQQLQFEVSEGRVHQD